MSKITINLNPQKDIAPTEIVQNIISYTPLFALAVAAVFVLIVLLQLFAFQKAHTAGVYKAKWSDWKDEDKLLKAIKTDIVRLETEKTAIEGILTPQYEAAKIFEDIYASLPKNIWFANIRFKEDFLSLRGYVVKWEEDYLASLDTFINSLRQRDYFSRKFGKVNIKESQKKLFNTVEALEFAIECGK